MARKKGKRAPREQLKIAGTGRLDRNPRIEGKAEEVRNICEQRIGLQDEEAGLRDELEEIMREEGTARYVYEGPDGSPIEVVVEPGDIKVSVRKVKKPRAKDAA